jgi:methyl-accepting chemotaxis protein
MLRTLKQKALAGAGLMLALVAACGAANVWTTTMLSEDLDHLERDANAIRAHLTADMMHDALRADVLAALAALSPESGISLTDVKADLIEHADVFRASIAEEQALDLSQEQRAALEAVEQPLADYIASAERLIQLAEINPSVAMAALPGFMSQWATLADAMEGVTEVLSAGVTANIADGSATSSQAVMVAALIIGVGLLVALMLAFGVIQLFITPISRMTDAMTRLSRGDDAVDVPYVGRKDEIGDMAASLAAFKQRRSSTIASARA